MIKKRLFLLTGLVLGLVLSGCKSGNSEVIVPSSQVQETETKQKIETQEEVEAEPLVAEKPLTMKEFGEKIIDVMIKENPDYEFEWKDYSTLSVYDSEEKTLTLNLVNAYNDYYVKGDDIDSVVEHFTKAALALLQEVDKQSLLSRDNIMATIKNEDYIEYARKQGVEPVCDELVEGLYILYMHDLPETAKPFTEEDLAEAGIERSEVRDLAVKNLTDTLFPLLQINEVDGVYLTACDGMYESGLILCDIWDLYPVTNDYIIGIPERSYLIIADSKNEEAIENMEIAGENLFNEASYPITNKLLYWTGSEFDYYTKE